MSERTQKPEQDQILQIKKEALGYVKSLFYNPEQLEKLDIYLTKEIKKEKRLEESIQTNIQNHVDSIKSTLKELRISMAEANCLQNAISEVDAVAKDMPKYFKPLTKLVAVSVTASRTNQTLGLLRKIIDMNSKIEKTKTMLSNMQLLEVHKNLRELENIRDRILSKNSDRADGNISKSVETNLLNKNFDPINKLSIELNEKIIYIISNLFTFCVNEPTHLVTALRIIEREEKIDDFWRENTKNYGAQTYCPPDRPKQWAKFVNQAIHQSALDKISKTRSGIDFSDKFALTNFFENIKKIFIDDLNNLQQYGVRCFPPSYQILTRVTQMFHEVIREVVNECLRSIGDTPSEIDIVALLLFEKEYLGDQMFGNKKFDKSILTAIRNCEPLIPAEIVQNLEFKYQTKVCENLTDKVSRIISLEKRALENDSGPPVVSGKYCTFLGTFYQDFVGIKITYSRRLSKNMFSGVYKYCVGAFEQLVSTYMTLLKTYDKDQWSSGQSQTGSNLNLGPIPKIFKSERNLLSAEDRSSPKYKNFVPNCIAFANNCIVIKNAANTLFDEGFSETSLNSTDSTLEEYRSRFTEIKNQADEISEKCLYIICDDYFWDLKDSFEELFSQKWATDATNWSDGFRGTLTGLSEFVDHLDESYRSSLFKKIDFCLAHKYLSRFMHTKLKFNQNEVKTLGDVIYNDGLMFSKFFADRCSGVPADMFCYVISMCAAVFRNPDTDCAIIDLANIAKKYSDFNKDHAIALLKKRNDFTKDKISETVKVVVENRKITPTMKTSVFSEIRF